MAQSRIFWIEGAARDLGETTPLGADPELMQGWNAVLRRASVARLTASTLDRALLGPLSPLRMVIEGPGLLLEPCHFLMRQNHILLLPTPSGAVAHGVDRVEAWLEEVSEWVDEFWQLRLVAGRLIAVPERPLEVVLGDPTVMWGGDVGTHRPHGPDAGRVMRLLNDLQMLLKQHPWPLGEGVNTLWPWGDTSGREARPAWRLRWSDESRRRPWYSGDAVAEEGPELLWYDDLLQPLAERDGPALLEAVGKLQNEILPQLQAGDRVVLAGGERGSTVLTVQGRNPLVAWFNRRQLAAVLAGQAPGVATLW